MATNIPINAPGQPGYDNSAYNPNNDPTYKGSMSATALSNPIKPADTQSIYADMQTKLGAIHDSLNSYIAANNPAPTTNTTDTGISPDMKAILNSYVPPTQPDYAGAETTAGIPDKQKTVNDLTAQINAFNANQQVQELKMKNEGISNGAIQGRDFALERQNAIAVLPLQAQLSAAQGDLTTATAHLDKLFGYQQDYAKAMMDFNNKKIDAVYNYATKKEQDALDAKKVTDAQAFTTLQNNLNQAQTWATTAISQRQGDLASKIMALDPKATDYQTKLGTLAGQIKPNAVSTSNTTFTSGGKTISDSAIVAGQSKLNTSRGGDGYANSGTYLTMLDLWSKDGMDINDFFKKYPPKIYLNPKDASIPQYIKDMLKANNGLNISSEDISGALNNNQ